MAGELDQQLGLAQRLVTVPPDRGAAPTRATCIPRASSAAASALGAAPGAIAEASGTSPSSRPLAEHGQQRRMLGDELVEVPGSHAGLGLRAQIATAPALRSMSEPPGVGQQRPRGRLAARRRAPAAARAGSREVALVGLAHQRRDRGCGGCPFQPGALLGAQPAPPSCGDDPDDLAADPDRDRLGDNRGRSAAADACG